METEWKLFAMNPAKSVVKRLVRFGLQLFSLLTFLDFCMSYVVLFLPMLCFIQLHLSAVVLYL